MPTKYYNIFNYLLELIKWNEFLNNKNTRNEIEKSNNFSNNNWKDIFQDIDIDWLGNDLVDLVVPRFFDVLLLDVARAGHYHGLGCPVLPVEAPDLIGELETVHDRHADISQH